MLQDFKNVSDHFGLLHIKVLTVEGKGLLSPPYYWGPEIVNENKSTKEV